MIRTSAEGAQNIAAQAFAANGFAVKWESPLKGKAEKGSKGANIALGALAQYYAIEFEIHPSQGGTTLRLVQGNTGLAGGVLGLMKVKKQFNQVSDSIAAWLQQNNMLVGVQK